MIRLGAQWKQITDTRCALASTMPRFRKKPPPPTTPTNSQLPTPTSPAKQAKERSYLRTKNQSALASPSNANALSTVPATCDPSDITPNESEPSKESVWRTTYAAAKIAVETAKESSDMFPPLKAVLGAISVLIKNCDVSFPQLYSPPDCRPTVSRSKPSQTQNRSRISRGE